jgi:AraC family transcriptional regulator
MDGQRIADLFNGKLRSVDEERPLLSSATTRWKGFLLERDACRPGFADSILYRHDQLIFITSGLVTVDDRAFPGPKRFAAAVGSFTTWPAGHECRSVRWLSQGPLNGLAEMIRIQLDSEVLHKLAPERSAAAAAPLAPCGGATDAELLALAQLMAAEVAAGCPSGPLYEQSLCLAFAARVYASRERSDSLIKGGLSRMQLSRACDYIDQHLGGELSLVKIAAEAGLSPRHFAVRFRCSVGVTPHRYVLARRINRARHMLQAGNVRVVDVALALGFSSQSHFIDVFHRAVGVTPRQFQRTR